MNARRWGMLFVALLLLGGNAWATSLGSAYAKFAGRGAADVARPYLDGTSLGSMVTGCYLVEVDGVLPRTGEGQWLPTDTPFGAFCVDLPQGVNSEFALYQVVPLDEAPTPYDGPSGMGGVRAGLIESLWAQHFDPAWATGSSWTYAQKQAAEAFGAAVWEIIYESPGSTLDVTAGRLKMTSLNTALANSWLSGLDPDGASVPLRALKSGEYQDYVVLMPAAPSPPLIPEPVTLAGLAAGVAALVGYLRKR